MKERTELVDDAISSGRSIRSVVDDAAAELTYDELVTWWVAAMTGRCVDELRKRAKAATTSPEQLALFKVAAAVPKIVRIVGEHGEDFVQWQYATPEQVSAHYAWARRDLLRQLGIVEQGEARWADVDLVVDVPLGMQLFTEPCPICHQYWSEGESPFEECHTDPVAGRSFNSETRWGHRDCNRVQGIK